MSDDTITHHAAELTKPRAVAGALQEGDPSARLILAAVPMVVYRAKACLPFDTLWVSENIERVSGYPRAMFLEQPGLFSVRVHPDDLPALNGLEEAIRTTGEAASEYRWQHRDGSWRWFLDKCSLTTGPDGQRVVTGTWLDITDRKSAEIALQESERRLALVLDATREGVWDWHIDTGEVHFSVAWSTSLGYAPDEVPSSVAFWESVVHPDDMPRVREALRAHFAGETPYYSCEDRLRTKSGEWRWNLDRGRVVERDAEGRPVRMVGTDTDITERRLAEEALRASEERLELAVEAAGIGIWDWDIASGTVTYSDRWVSMLGYEPGAFAPTFEAWRDLLRQEDQDRVVAYAGDYLAGRIPIYHLEFRMRRASGDWSWIESRARITRRDAEGRPTRLTGVHVDITERKRAEDELAQSRERALQAEHLAALGTLAAGTAHELNSPLGSILLAASYGLELAEEGKIEPLAECLRDIGTQARRGREIVESVLLFAADEPTRRLPTDVADLVDEAVRTVAPRAAERGATIEVLPHGPLPEILVNRHEISRVLVNLLQNAAESGAEVRVTVVLEHGGDMMRVHVRDNGSGIPEGASARIFEPFFTTRRGRGGTGLGLSIAHGIVRRHGGRIHVESAPDRGTTFTVELPLPT